MNQTTTAPVRRLSPAEIRRRYPDGGLQLLAQGAHAVQLTDLRPFLEFAEHAGPLRSIHSHDGRTVHGLDLELLGFSGGALDDLALEVLARHTGRVDEIGGEL